MSTTLSVRISVTKSTTGDVYEGTISPIQARPTKLLRADNTTKFPTRAAVVARARNWAKLHGYNDVNFVEPGAAKAATAKKAAKKSAVTTSKATPAKASTPKATKTNTTSTSAQSR